MQSRKMIRIREGGRKRKLSLLLLLILQLKRRIPRITPNIGDRADEEEDVVERVEGINNVVETTTTVDVVVIRTTTDEVPVDEGIHNSSKTKSTISGSSINLHPKKRQLLLLRPINQLILLHRIQNKRHQRINLLS